MDKAWLEEAETKLNALLDFVYRRGMNSADEKPGEFNQQKKLQIDLLDHLAKAVTEDPPKQLRLRAMTSGEVAEVKPGADRSDELFALNVLRKFCRMHGLVLTDWDGNDASGVKACASFDECHHGTPLKCMTYGCHNAAYGATSARSVDDLMELARQYAHAYFNYHTGSKDGMLEKTRAALQSALAAGLKATSLPPRVACPSCASTEVECASCAANFTWDASQIKQPNWAHVQTAFVEGAKESRSNPDAVEEDFLRAADGYTKRVFEEVDPVSEAALRTGSWERPSKKEGTEEPGQCT